VSGEVVRLDLRTAEVEPIAAPVAIPPYVVEAIATAAVEAYKAAKREEARLASRAYYRVNREAVLERQRLRREAAKAHPTRPRTGD
jgi:hypothetical protein